jgi:hypothetical protein
MTTITNSVYDYGDTKFVNCSFASVIAASATNRSPIFNSRIMFENCEGISDRRQIPKIGSIMKNTGAGVTLPADVDHVVECFIDGTSSIFGRRNEDDDFSDLGYAPICIEWRVWQTVLTSKTYRAYVQSVTDNLTAVEMWMQVDYPGNSNSDLLIVKSDEAITARSSAADFSQYLEAACTCAVAGWVTIRVFLAKYDATDMRFIKPLLEISGSSDLVTPYYSYGDSILQNKSTASGGGGGTKSRSGNILGIKRGSY